MQQRNSTVEDGADPLKYEVRRPLVFVGYDPDEACTGDFEPGDILRVVLRNGCGMGIDVVRESDGRVDMVWPNEVVLLPVDRWNPRFVAYARAHGHDPDEQLRLDADAYPGGKMTGFILWIGDRWATWRRENGLKRDDILGPADYQSFDRSIGIDRPLEDYAK